MAVLSKIRDRSVFLIIIIGMALFAFVVPPKKIMSFFSSKKTNSIGSINGEDITREEFIEEVKAYKAGRETINDSQAANAVWENLTSEKIYSSQLKEAGIVVGEKDIWEAIINHPSIKNSPEFLNEAGLFDEELLKSYIADLEEDTSAEGKTRFHSWLSFERSIKQGLERSAYLNLVKAGLGVSNSEGKNYYFLNNTKVNGRFVLLPLSKIADSTISVSDTDVKKYIDAHKNEFQVEASRSLQYVVFDLKASDADKEAIKKELTDLIPDTGEYKGLQNTTDYDTFISENSDLPYSDRVVFKNSLKTVIADTLFNSPVGTIYGPYEEGDYFKLTKIVSKEQVPSVKASHILVAYNGALRAKPEISRTKEEAKARANELLRKVRKKSVNFADEAKISSDGPSAGKGGDLGWFKEGAMVPAFNDWVFSHKKGDIGIVETDFGFHVIKIDDTKSEEGLKLATLAKSIVPSDETESKVFVEAETFAASIAKGKDFTELANASKYVIKNAQKIKKKDENVPGLTGNNRQIITWAFNDNTKLADAKRFDIDKAYVVAQVTQKEAKGLQTVKSAFPRVKSKVIRQKKVALLSKKLQSGSLEEIAKAENIRVQSTGDTSFENPSSSAPGRDKAVVGALLGMKEGAIARGIEGKTGVYAVELIKKTPPIELDSYEPYRVQLEKKLKKDDNTIYSALKEASNVEDYRD
jgi:peptidylprolyl isomerase/peptidyl-prolyl cis-trans isomerase D